MRHVRYQTKQGPFGLATRRHRTILYDGDCPRRLCSASRNPDRTDHRLHRRPPRHVIRARLTFKTTATVLRAGRRSPGTECVVERDKLIEPRLPVAVSAWPMSYDVGEVHRLIFTRQTTRALREGMPRSCLTPTTGIGRDEPTRSRS